MSFGTIRSFLSRATAPPRLPPTGCRTFHSNCIPVSPHTDSIFRSVLTSTPWATVNFRSDFPTSITTGTALASLTMSKVLSADLPRKLVALSLTR